MPVSSRTEKGAGDLIAHEATSPALLFRLPVLQIRVERKLETRGFQPLENRLSESSFANEFFRQLDRP